jgi:hypothetical protein
MTEETWSTLSDGDVFGASAAERQSLAAIKGRDDLADICAAVTQQIREAYSSGGRALGDDGTIPDGLRGRAIAIAAWRFVSEGVPQNEGIQTASRREAFDEAVSFLKQIAGRQIRSAGSAQTVTRVHRQATRRKLEGLA